MSSQPEPQGPYIVRSDPAAAHDPPPPVIAIMSDATQPLVAIHADGHIEYGPGYQPDAAARIFWGALRDHMPTRCANCGHVDGQGAA